MANKGTPIIEKGSHTLESLVMVFELGRQTETCRSSKSLQMCVYRCCRILRLGFFFLVSFCTLLLALRIFCISPLEPNPKHTISSLRAGRSRTRTNESIPKSYEIGPVQVDAQRSRADKPKGLDVGHVLRKLDWHHEHHPRELGLTWCVRHWHLIGSGKRYSAVSINH